nr:TonB family protein [Porphyromonas cangingivalis]
MTVNPQGEVIRARITRTKIESPEMRRSAINAAKATRFNPIEGISNNQTGTITYRYRLR